MESDDFDNPPGDWFEDDTLYEFQRAFWRDGLTGRGVVVDERREPWHEEGEPVDLYVFVVPQNSSINAEPIETLIEGTKDERRAVEEAWEYMAAHSPDGDTE